MNFSGIKLQELFAFAGKDTRWHSLGLERHHKSVQTRARCFINKAVPLWNQLPEHMVNGSNFDRFEEFLDVSWVAVYSELAGGGQTDMVVATGREGHPFESSHRR